MSFQTTKICDVCKKEVKFSEFALFHFRKRRDFCSLECFLNWVSTYAELSKG